MKRRGKSQQTRILEALRDSALESVEDREDLASIEQAFFKHTTDRALDKDDPHAAMLLQVLWNKGWPGLKPVAPNVEFKLEGETDTERAKSILAAIAGGEIPPDIGTLLLGSLKDLSVIEANEGLKARIEAIEKALGV